MILLERIGIDFGRRLPLEQAITWAAGHAVRFIDVQLDTGQNRVSEISDVRASAICRQREEAGITLGLHTLSAVNVAEYSPFVSEAADEYMRAYIDVAPKLGASWIVVHAGYHFSADVKPRMEAGRDRLKRMAEYAEKQGARLLLENLNKEPVDAEVHYLAHTIEEWHYYYSSIQSPALALSFTANHAHLMPEGVQGFVDSIPLERVEEVRLADCFRNGHEQHLRPGEGDFDFGALFSLLEGRGYKGHYMNAFGTIDDMEQARHDMVRMAQGAMVESR